MSVATYIAECLALIVLGTAFYVLLDRWFERAEGLAMNNPKHVSFRTCCIALAHHLTVIQQLKAPQQIDLTFFGGVSVKVGVMPDPSGKRNFDTVFFDGRRIGNRNSACQEYTSLCAPVLASVATGELKPSGRFEDVRAILWPNGEV